jgi:hypothetical protein
MGVESFPSLAVIGGGRGVSSTALRVAVVPCAGFCSLAILWMASNPMLGRSRTSCVSCVTAQTVVDVDALVKTASFSSLSSDLILLTSVTLLTSLPDSRRSMSAMKAVIPSINLGRDILLLLSHALHSSHSASANLAVDFNHNYDVEKMFFDQVSCPGLGT